MALEIRKFQCEICGQMYDDMVSAQTCESRGLPPDYPVGLIFYRDPEEEIDIEEAIEISNNRLTGVDEDLAGRRVFAVAWTGNLGGHDTRGTFYVCYDEPTPHDILGGELAVINESLRLGGGNAVASDHPSTLHMALILHEMGIHPSFWDGEKPVVWDVSLLGKDTGPRYRYAFNGPYSHDATYTMNDAVSVNDENGIRQYGCKVARSHGFAPPTPPDSENDAWVLIHVVQPPVGEQRGT